MRLKAFIFALSLFASLPFAQAQLPNGSIAPNVTFNDINGQPHDLYSILDQGYSVVFDAFATWCGICWNYDNTGILKNLYASQGPLGTNKIRMFMIEASPSTTAPCITGSNECMGGTIGDWTTGVQYPIVHIESGNQANFSALYNIPGYPTLYIIAPNKKIYLVGQANLQTWLNYVESTQMEATGSASNSICFNDGMSGVDIDVSGGFGTLSYAWDNGATTQDISNVPPGSYNVSITDTYGHEVEAGPFLVSGPSTPLNVTPDQQGDVSCNGANDGFINVNVFGGGTNYTFNWNNGENSQNISGLAGGIYSLTATDNFGCTEDYTAQVVEPPILSLSTNGTNENCSQGDGIITLNASGGANGYLYNIGNGFVSTNVFTNLTAGAYMTSVMDANACVTSEMIELSNNPEPVADAGADVTIDCIVSDVTLNGANSSSGAGITYSWFASNGGNIVSGSNTLTPLVNAPGTYTLEVTNGPCTEMDVVQVTGDITAPIASISGNDPIDCYANSSTLTADPVTGNVSYAWIDENGATVGTQETVIVGTPGVYTLEITNLDNGCVGTDNATVVENTLIPLISIAAPSVLNCNVSSVVLSATVTQGGASNSFEWTNDQGAVIGTSESVSVTQEGTYTVEVTNITNGCIAFEQVTVLADIIAPTADAGPDQTLTCNTGMVTLGGTSSTGTDIIYEWIDQNGAVISTDATVDVIASGIYTLIVTNTTNGCVSNSQANVLEDATPPIADAGSNQELNCTNIVVQLGGNSSTGNVNYEWFDEANVSIGDTEGIEVDNAGTYTLVVTNTDNGCTSSDQTVVTIDQNYPTANAGSGGQLDCSNSEITLDATSSSSGNNIEYEWQSSSGTVVGNTAVIQVSTADVYTLMITNIDNGCDATDQVTVTSSNDFPTADAAANSAITCTNSTVVLDGDGSTSGNNISYEWQNNAGSVIGTDLEISVTEAGTYTLFVMNNANGCSASTDFLVQENMNAPNADAQLSGTLHCNNATVTLDATSSSGNSLIYEWEFMGNVVGNSATYSASTPGVYQLNLTDGQNGCTDAVSITVVQENAVGIALTGISSISCHGGSSGSASVSANGGSGDFDYVWSDGSQGPAANNLSAGSYTVTATDGNGCQAEFTVQLSEPDELDIEVSSTGETADNANDGTATATASGGVGNFQYTWSNNQTGQTISNLEPGTYTVTASDDNNCEIIEVVNVGSFACAMQFSSQASDISCQGSNDGFVSVNTAMEVASIEWSNGETGAMINNLSAGTYAYTITDFNNCVYNGMETISEPEALTAQIVFVNNIECGGGELGSAQIEVQGGTGQYNYMWSSGETTPVANQLMAGMQSVTVEDENGCQFFLSVMILDEDNEFPVAVAQNIYIELGADGNTQIDPADADAGSTDNCGIMSFSLSQTSFDCSNLGFTEVEFTVTDFAGNASTQSIFVSIEDVLDPEIECSSSIVSYACDPLVFDLPSINDNCGNLQLDLIAGIASGNTFPEGTTTNTYRVTDASGNTAECSFDIEVIHDLDGVLESTDANCFGDASGTAVMEPTGGTPGYNYLWSNGQESSTANGLAAGEHSVIVTDNGGCIEQFVFEIGEPTELILSLDDVQNDADGMDSGSIDISVDGGTPPYNFVWTTGGIFHSSEEDLSGLAAGNYDLSVTDSKGCQVTSFGITIEDLTGTFEQLYANEIALYPNPTRDLVQIEFEFTETHQVDLDVRDVAGKVILSQNLGQVKNNSQQLSLGNFAGGIYFLDLKVDGKLVTKKLVVVEE